MAYVTEWTHEQEKIVIENETLIHDQLQHLLTHGDHLSDADALYALAWRLYSEDLDMGLALEIHLALIPVLRNRGDRDRLLRSLYAGGIICFYLQQKYGSLGKYAKMSQLALELFNEGASYKAQYLEIDNQDTCMYIHRCLGNVYVTLSIARYTDAKAALPPFLTSLDEALQFWQDERIRTKHPHFPWEMLVNNAQQSICTWLDILRDQPADQRDLALAMRIYNSYTILEKQMKDENLHKTWTHQRTRYVQVSSSLYIGKISSDTYIREMRSLFYSAHEDDYSPESAYCMLYIPTVMIAHIHETSRSIDKWVKREVDAIITRVAQYLRGIPASLNMTDLFSTIIASTRDIGKWMEYHDYIALMRKLFVESDLNSYARGIHLQKLVGIITRHSYGEDKQAAVSLSAWAYSIKKAICACAVASGPRRHYPFEMELLEAYDDSDILMHEDSVSSEVKSIIQLADSLETAPNILEELDPPLRDDLRQCLDLGRAQAYYEAYCAMPAMA